MANQGIQDIPRETIHVAGLPISHAVMGTGQPIVMLHGWGADLTLVWPLAQRLVMLGYRVYVPDLLGFGQSPEPPVTWTVFDYTDFVVSYLDSQEIEQAHLFGHSFGGRLGLILASDHAKRILTMTLANAAGIRTPPPLTSRLRLNVYKTVRDTLQKLGLKGVSETLRHTYNKRYGSADFNAVSGIMRQTFINVIQQDLRDYARRVSVPTLLIWGDKDDDTPLKQGQELERLIPDAGLVVYKGAGHYSYLENSQQTAQAMHALIAP
jgi:pimeloyl-ACP methyl ester carboxylesterase